MLPVIEINPDALISLECIELMPISGSGCPDGISGLNPEMRKIASSSKLDRKEAREIFVDGVVQIILRRPHLVKLLCIYSSCAVRRVFPKAVVSWLLNRLIPPLYSNLKSDKLLLSPPLLPRHIAGIVRDLVAFSH